MKIWAYVAGYLLIAAAWASAAETAPRIIPAPVELETRPGTFHFTAQTRISASGRARIEAVKLTDYLAAPMGHRLELVETSENARNLVSLRIDPSLADRLGREGYELDVQPGRITIRAADSPGLFYAIQTMRQLLPPAVFGRRKVEGIPWTVPCVRIVDYPRFLWRGLLIDPARHFIPLEDVKKFIDAMAVHKLNHLQIHLTDNEGWRIEIKRYPGLTKLGSKMDWTSLRKGGEPTRTGFYTQEQIRELVQYASQRHITIVPEIEMPYHTGAAIVAYPELGIGTANLAESPPERRWGKTKGLIAPRPATVAFLQNVLSEVIELFPSRYVHIGGDEANIQHWANDPEMQAQISQLKLKDAHELHSWFIRQMDAFLAEKGRRLVGWDEILQGGLAPGATVMSWRGTAGGIAAARAGHAVVMTPTSHTYFDYRQAPDENGLGRNVIDLRKVYAFEPIPAELDKNQSALVLGGQAQLWGELIPDQKRREFMGFPRACALAEVLWSQRSQRDFSRFSLSLADHLKRLDIMEVNYRPPDKP